MQTGDSCAAFIVRKDKEIAAFRVHCGVIRGAHLVFAAIAGPDSEWNEWRAMQQFSDAGNHLRILSHGNSAQDGQERAVSRPRNLKRGRRSAASLPAATCSAFAGA